MGIGSDRQKDVSYFRWRGHLGILLNRLKDSHVRLHVLPAIANTELHGKREKCIFFSGFHHCVSLTLASGYRACSNQGRRDTAYQPLSLPTWLLLGRCQQPPNPSTNIRKMGVLSNRDVKVKNLLLFFVYSPPFLLTIWEWRWNIFFLFKGIYTVNKEINHWSLRKNYKFKFHYIYLICMGGGREACRCFLEYTPGKTRNHDTTISLPSIYVLLPNSILY